MFIFSNSLYYSLCLLLIVLFFLSYLFSNYFISSITLLILCIVYIGAIIILIGYVCAVCPNILVSSSLSSFAPLFLVSLICYLLSDFSSPNLSFSINFITSFFYTLDGLLLFGILVLILFLTLLMVTTYHSNPKGPFRSIS